MVKQTYQRPMSWEHIHFFCCSLNINHRWADSFVGDCYVLGSWPPTYWLLKRSSVGPLWPCCDPELAEVALDQISEQRSIKRKKKHLQYRTEAWWHALEFKETVILLHFKFFIMKALSLNVIKQCFISNGYEEKWFNLIRNKWWYFVGWYFYFLVVLTP